MSRTKNILLFMIEDQKHIAFYDRRPKTYCSLWYKTKNILLFMIEDQKHIAFYDRRLALTTKMNFRRVAKWDGVFTHNRRVTFWNPTVALDQALGHNLFKIPYSAKIYLFQRSSSVFIVNLESTRKRCGLCSS